VIHTPGQTAGAGTCRVAFIFALALYTSSCFAQSAPVMQVVPTEAASFRIAGRIVSAADGHALQGATVRIVSSKTGQEIAFILAGPDGGFVFPGLKADKYRLQGSAHGYLASAYDEHEGFSTAIVTGAGVDTESLLMRLMPTAMLSGRLTDEVGDPVRRATVTLYRENRNQGVSRITRFRNAQTDDLGAYEMSGLTPGNYFLSATGTPWYAMHPQLSPRNATGAMGPVDPIDPSLDVAYPMAFYDGAQDSSGATLVPLKGGDDRTIDLHLAPQPAITLTIHPAPGEELARIPQLQRKVFDDFEPVSGGQSQSAQSEAMMTGIPPGQYLLRQIDPRNGGLAGSTTISLEGRSVDTDMTAGEAPGIVKMLLQGENGVKLPAHMQILLRTKDPGVMANKAANDKSEAEFDGVKPGEYRCTLSGEGRQFYVTRILSDGKSIPNGALRVTSGATLSVTVVATTGSVAVQGFARQDGKPAAGIMIVLVPSSESANVDLFRRDQSDLDGSFTLPNVTPGKYTVLAIEDGWQLEWGKPEVLARYLPQGALVTISDSEARSVQLPQAVVVQPR
jgi:Carboxypeptidase regulatory-like domain